MNEYRIQNFIDFHEVVEGYNARSVIYRGVKSVSFPLIPKIGRLTPPDSIGSREQNEQEIPRPIGIGSPLVSSMGCRHAY
jgi:hypothetical protein